MGNSIWLYLYVRGGISGNGQLARQDTESTILGPVWGEGRHAFLGSWPRIVYYRQTIRSLSDRPRHH